MAMLIGKTLGKYKLTEILGRGGMAEVYKAYHPQLDRPVTIKVLHSFLAGGGDFLARFKREAKAVAALRQAHIVQIYDFDVQDETYYMVMEFIDDGTLQARMAGLADAGAYMPVEQVLSILRQVAEALDYAHRHGIIHRDIKPSNILLDSSGDAYLTDFGIARMLSTTQFTATGALIGTPTYMSPEQALGEEMTGASDIYSLGVILFELLTGKTPFASDTPLAVIHKHIHEPPPQPSSLRPELAGELEAVILKALEKAPQARHQSAKEMAQALEKALTPQLCAKLDERTEPGSAPFAELPTQVMQDPIALDRAQMQTEIMGEQTRAGLVSPHPPAEISESVPVEVKAAGEQETPAPRLPPTAKKEPSLIADDKPKRGIRFRPKNLFIGIGAVGLIAVIAFIVISNWKPGNENDTEPLAAAQPTKISVTTLEPTATKPAPTPAATATGPVDPTMYDDFDNSTYNGNYNNSLWSPETGSTDFVIGQSNGNLSIKVHDQAVAGLRSNESLLIKEPTFFEARLYLDPQTTENGSHLFFWVIHEEGYSSCGIFKAEGNSQQIACWSEYFGSNVDADLGLDDILPGWHTLRFEIEPETMIISYVIDGIRKNSYNPKVAIADNFDHFKQSEFNVGVALHNFGPSKEPVGYIDYVRMGVIEDKATAYDNFDGDALNTALWSIYQGGAAKETSVVQSGGSLELKYTGIGEFGISPVQVTWEKIVEPRFYEAKIYLEPSSTPTGSQMLIEVSTDDGWTICVLSNNGDEKQSISCDGSYFGVDFFGKVAMGDLSPSWHLVRIEFWPQRLEIAFYVDGTLIGTLSGSDFLKAQEIFEQEYPSIVGVGMNNFIENVSLIGYVDFVRSGKIADDPALYDAFDTAKYENFFDTSKWGNEERNAKGEVAQKDGVLVFTQSGVSQVTTLSALKYWETRINEPMFFEAKLKIDRDQNGVIVLQLWGDVIESGSCGLHSMPEIVAAHCWTRTEDPHIQVPHGTWHTVRIEVDTDKNMSTFFIDGLQLAVDQYEQPIQGSLIYLGLQAHAGPGREEDTLAVKGYVDDVRVGPLE